MVAHTNLHGLESPLPAERVGANGADEIFEIGRRADASQLHMR